MGHPRARHCSSARTCARPELIDPQTRGRTRPSFTVANTKPTLSIGPANVRDLKKIAVPVLVMHGDDDQIVPHSDSAPLSTELLGKSTLKTYWRFGDNTAEQSR